MNTRTLTKWEPQEKRRDTRHCELSGCRRATTGRKPYCTEHLDEMPYVRVVREELARREAEWERVGRLGARAVDPAGSTVHELLMYLRTQGEATVRRLAKDLSMDLELVTAYVASLRKRKMVQVTETGRGVPLVTFVQDDPSSSGSRSRSEMKAA